MILNLSHRKATLHDLPTIVKLLVEEDALSQSRELYTPGALDERYIQAFHKIDHDAAQYLMVVEQEKEVVGTCHLTLIPSLTFIGASRLQIEAVRVAHAYRGQKIGEWMIHQAIAYGKAQGAAIIQLTTNKKRLRAKSFYEKLGFEASHEGMKFYL